MCHIRRLGQVSFEVKVECHIWSQSQVSHIEAKSIITDFGKDKCHILRQSQMSHNE